MLRFTFLIVGSLFLFSNICCDNDSVQSKNLKTEKVIVGYVPGFRGELDVSVIDPMKITHINYAFVDVKDSMAWLTNRATDTVNFRKLNQLKKINPELKILISIGGWSWSENFSDAVLTQSSRRKFAQSAVNIMHTYDLDGVDIDWEYPGLKGEDNVFREVDKQNFTHMFVAIRAVLDSLTNQTGKNYLLTSAVAGFKAFLDNTEMAEAAKPQDFINVMCYDYYTGGPKVGHHSNLLPPENYDHDRSAKKDLDMFIAAGVPPGKLVLGLPFYGRSWILPNAENHGIHQIRDSVLRAGGYTFIKDSLINRNGFVRYWDENAQAPYLFNEERNQLIVYDDEESVKIKCQYVLDHDLAGVMFWQYMSDPKEYLLDAINASLK